MARAFGRSFVALTLALVAASGCSMEPVRPRTERTGAQISHIINGSLDTTHQAVVAVFIGNGACTGTIIGKSGGYGYVLTAAHCVEGSIANSWVVQGNDYNSQNTSWYPIDDALADPAYDGQKHDFAMIRFQGATNATPVIPALTPAEDSLTAGTQVDHVGYGITSVPNGDTSLRHHVVGPLSHAYGLTIEYDQANNGPCSGDSGGPQLTLGTERVAGVTSYGDADCVVYGVSGRVSAVYNSFILPYMNGGGPVTTSSTTTTTTTTTTTDPGSGGSGASGAGAGSGVGGSDWVAGNAEDRRYTGEIAASCSYGSRARARNSDGAGLFALMLGGAFIAGARARRRAR